jgi:membrane protein
MKLFRLLGRAAIIWFRRDADVHAAALAYFVPFAITPLVLLSMTLVGMIIGGAEVATLLTRWGNSLNPDLTELLFNSVRNFSILTTAYLVPILAILFFSGMVLLALNSLSAGLQKIWGVPMHGVRNWFRRSGHSILFILFLQAYLVGVIILNRTILFISHIPLVHILELLYPALLFISTLVLITIGYGLLSLSAPPLRARLYGAVVASCLFLFTRQLVALHTGLSPVPDLFGAAGLVIVLLIWIYVSASILFYGAAFAVAYEESRLSQKK